MTSLSTTYAATPVFYTLAGIYDDVLILHESIMTTLNERCQAHWDEETSFFDASLSAILNECKAPLKKLLNAFFGKHAKLFFDSEKQLFVTDKTLLKIAFVWMDVNKTKPLTFIFKQMSLGDFCATLEKIAAELIYFKAQREGENVTQEEVFSALDDRFRYLETVFWKDRCGRMTTEARYPRECPKLYVYKILSQVSCYKNHKVVQDECVVDLAGAMGKTVRLPIHRCLTCGKLFIGVESYKIFTEEYGLMLFERLPDESMKRDQDQYFKNFNSESKLHRMGYNVAAGGLTEKERRALLISLLENKYMSYLEICADIENAIRIFEGRPNYDAALTKWRRDLRFIAEYVLKPKG